MNDEKMYQALGVLDQLVGEAIQADHPATEFFQQLRGSLETWMNQNGFPTVVGSPPLHEAEVTLIVIEQARQWKKLH